MIDLDRKGAGAGAYPIVLVSYLIACEQYVDPAQGELVRNYFEWVVSDEAQQEAERSAGSAPLTAGLAKQARDAVFRIR